MRFLVDTSLPPALAVWLGSEGHEAVHTFDIGLGKAKDREIWDRAVADGAVIVSKDEDFALLKVAKPAGPAIVWVRIGNAIRRVILARRASAWPSVVKALSDGQGIVEVR